MIIQRNALLKQLAEQLPFDPDLPWASLDDAVRQQIMYGTGDRLFEFKLKPGRAKPEPTLFRGVLYELEQSYRSTSSEGLRARYLKISKSTVVMTAVASVCGLKVGQFY